MMLNLSWDWAMARYLKSRNLPLPLTDSLGRFRAISCQFPARAIETPCRFSIVSMTVSPSISPVNGAALNIYVEPILWT